MRLQCFTEVSHDSGRLSAYPQRRSVADSRAPIPVAILLSVAVLRALAQLLANVNIRQIDWPPTGQLIWHLFCGFRWALKRLRRLIGKSCRTAPDPRLAPPCGMHGSAPLLPQVSGRKSPGGNNPSAPFIALVSCGLHQTADPVSGHVQNRATAQAAIDLIMLYPQELAALCGNLNQ